MLSHEKIKVAGFTLIELLIVIAIMVFYLLSQFHSSTSTKAGPMSLLQHLLSMKYVD